MAMHYYGPEKLVCFSTDFIADPAGFSRTPDNIITLAAGLRGAGIK